VGRFRVPRLASYFDACGTDFKNVMQKEL